MIKALFQLFLLVGSEWVLWVLALCSLLSLAVIIDRSRKVRVLEKTGSKLWQEQIQAWISGSIPDQWVSKSEELFRQYPCVESGLLNTLSKSSSASSTKLEKIGSSFLNSQRIELERNLAVLGTLGNSAPFIGLFGTVLGIIKAFSELDKMSAGAGISVVSGGLAEALVTTAAGLLVAIPSAIAYNYFQRKIKTISSRTSTLTQLISSSVGEG
jgi:biopolymer transport protein ExbB